VRICTVKRTAIVQLVWWIHFCIGFVRHIESLIHWLPLLLCIQLLAVQF